MTRQDKRAVLTLLLMMIFAVIFLVSTKQIKGGIQNYIPKLYNITHTEASGIDDEQRYEDENYEFYEDNDVKEEQAIQNDEIIEDNDIKEEQMKNHVEAD